MLISRMLLNILRFGKGDDLINYELWNVFKNAELSIIPVLLQS